MEQQHISEEKDTRLTVRQNQTDAMVIDAWVRSRKSVHTQDAYRRDGGAFLAFTGKGLQATTVTDILNYKETLSHYKDTSRSRKLYAVKSLLSYCYRTGYTRFNVGEVVELEQPKDTLAERLLTQGQVENLLRATEGHARNHALVHLLYKSGMRVSEACSLLWRDVKPRENGYGQVTIYGKGHKTRHVMLKPSVFAELLALRGTASDDNPVFTGRSDKEPISRRQVERLVQAAAKRAGIHVDAQRGRSLVSPHWLRHAHATHSIRKHAPLPLVQSTLGHKTPVTTTKYVHVLPDDSSALYLDD